MSIDLTIRPVTIQDYDQWLPLWEGYNAFYGRSGETELAPAITQMTWARFFDADEPVHALVAENEEKLFGLAHYLFSPKYHVNRAGMLFAGFVYPGNGTRKRCRQGFDQRNL
jgi:hypothetical protein